MGRIRAEIVSVACLALLAVGLPAGAQSAQEMKPAPASAAKPERRGIWVKVEDGIWKASIPRFSDKEEEVKPEFAVVRLAAAKYEELQKDPKKFLNEHKIFDKDIKQLDVCLAAQPKEDGPKISYWYISMQHWPGSSARCQAFPGWGEPKN